MKMEKYRAKQRCSWNEMAARLRQLPSGKRLCLEKEEREQLLRCLGILQKNIKIESAQSMIECLENITRQLGLKLTKDRKRVTDSQAVEFEVFISSEMFYVEVVIESNGRVRDVKIAHHGDPVCCLELCNVLQASDFAAFSAHLEGLISIYKLNCDKSMQYKAYIVLQSLEKKLVSMANLQKEITDIHELLFKSPVGLLLPRRGGFPMQLTFFASPYDFVDDRGKRLPFTVERINRNKLGWSVSILIDNLEQTNNMGSITVSDNAGSHSAGAGKTSSFPISGASYTMKLSRPLAVDTESLAKIQAVTGLDVRVKRTEPLVKLITSRDYAEAFHVKLPDQNHTYYIFDGSRSGVMVEAIPFTSSKQVPPVLELLRHQCFFNCLISSCVRNYTPKPDDFCHVLEVSPNELNAVCVSFEHPLDCESLMTVELRFDSILDSQCQSFFKSENNNSFISDAHVATVLRMSFSIPVVMRSVLNKANVLKSLKSSETLKIQSKGSYTLSNAATLGPTQDSFYDIGDLGDNMAADCFRHELVDLETFGPQQSLDLALLSPDPWLGQELNHNSHQSDLSEVASVANQQVPLSMIDDSLPFSCAFSVPKDTEDTVQGFELDGNRPDFIRSNSKSPSTAEDRRQCERPHPHNNVMRVELSAMSTHFDSNQRSLATSGDSSDSPSLTMITAISPAARLTASVKATDDRKRSKFSSKSKKSVSSHGKKKEGSSSKDRSSTKSSRFSSKSSSSKYLSSKEKKRNSGNGSSRSKLAAGFDWNLKKDLSSRSKHSSSSAKQFTVRQSSSAEGMKLTINKGRAPESESKSFSSKLRRSSPKSKSRAPVSSSQVEKDSPSGETLPHHHTILPVMPVADDENDAIDLVEKRLRALHGDEASLNPLSGIRPSAGNSGVGSHLFEDAFLE